MAFSSVSVVGSSLTLKWWKRPKLARRAEEEEEGGDFLPEGIIFEMMKSLGRRVGGWRRSNGKEYDVVREEEEEFIPLVGRERE